MKPLFKSTKSPSRDALVCEQVSGEKDELEISRATCSNRMMEKLFASNQNGKEIWRPADTVEVSADAETAMPWGIAGLGASGEINFVTEGDLEIHFKNAFLEKKSFCALLQRAHVGENEPKKFSLLLVKYSATEMLMARVLPSPLRSFENQAFASSTINFSIRRNIRNVSICKYCTPFGGISLSETVYVGPSCCPYFVNRFDYTKA